MDKFQSGDVVRFKRHSTAGGPNFGKYLEEAIIVRLYTKGYDDKEGVFQIQRPNGQPGFTSCNAYGCDLDLIAQKAIKGDDDEDCI